MRFEKFTTKLQEAMTSLSASVTKSSKLTSDINSYCQTGKVP